MTMQAVNKRFAPEFEPLVDELANHDITSLAILFDAFTAAYDAMNGVFCQPRTDHCRASKPLFDFLTKLLIVKEEIALEAGRRCPATHAEMTQRLRLQITNSFESGDLEAVFEHAASAQRLHNAWSLGLYVEEDGGTATGTCG